MENVVRHSFLRMENETLIQEFFTRRNTIIFTGILTTQWAIMMAVHPDFIKYFLTMGTFSHNNFNGVFPFTWASAFILFLYFIKRFGKKGVILGIGADFSATFLFEFVYQGLIKVSDWTQNLAILPIYLSNFIFGLVILPYSANSKALRLSILVWALLWVGWLVVGSPEIYSPWPRSGIAYAFNVPLKVLTFALYGLALRR